MSKDAKEKMKISELRVRPSADLLESVREDVKENPKTQIQCGYLSETSSISSKPLDICGNETKRGSRIMWVHLQASICTEWEQSSMVMMTGSEVQQDPDSGSVNTGLSNLPQQHSPGKDSISRSLSSLTSPGQNGFKRPRTIHRCILKTSTSLQDALGSGLVCHVCISAYSTYKSYLTHLMDTTCLKLQQGRNILNTKDCIYSAVSAAREEHASSTPPVVHDFTTLKTNILRGIMKDTPLEEVLKSNLPKNTKYPNMEISSNNPIKNLKRARNMYQVGNTPDLDQDIQIIFDQIHPHSFLNKKAKLSTETGLLDEEEKKNTRVDIKKEVEHVLLGIGDPEFDDQAASETLLMLSSVKNSNASTIVSARPRSPWFTTREQGRIISYCPCSAALRLQPLTMQENAVDICEENDLHKKLSTFLISLLGEKRLREYGFPKLEMNNVLKKILTVANVPVAKMDSGSGMQKVFRSSRYRLQTLKTNIIALLQICVPDVSMWNLFGWKDCNAGQILQICAENGLNKTWKISQEQAH
ncbi:uncharacterized protein LOC111707510 isoform X2 [Eurytemora carolleeae]|uniref:uncharacterized protein LOC111707510 isoform X2 n=1 Tax=Eurytemora carolleeae TaxID=1294199 RepID=UPI000C78C3CA|nr:uncharacterized protein LOC111707510 isoform X2 [Eurytemora carolleeae]|eukprot:XP_023336385.1 uncharacterized protein LOC111707510 isoform X2 [Eurytemora affinis]